MSKNLISNIFIIVCITTISSVVYFFSWPKYKNTAYNYSIQYPKHWVIDPDKSYINEVNSIYSIVNMYDRTMQNTVSVEVSQNDVTAKFRKNAFKVEEIKIGKTPVTAYFFKSEYSDCGPLKSEEFCSYFLIPVKHGNFWYTLSAGGKITSFDGVYRRILATFRFM